MTDEIVHIDQDRARAAGGALIAHAETIRRTASGVDRDIPAVPYDWFDLRHLIIRLDEAREAHDQRLAAKIGELGQRAITQADETHAVDRFG